MNADPDIDAALRVVLACIKLTSAVPRKPAYRWRGRVSRCFDCATALIGVAQATPGEILQYIKDEDLTREIVSSHLQKTREKLMKIHKRRWLSNADCGGWPAAFWQTPGFSGFTDEQIKYFVGQIA